MCDYLLDYVKLDSVSQVYSIFCKTDNALTIVSVDSPRELAYHKNFPMSLNVGDKATCGDSNSTEVIRLK